MAPQWLSCSTAVLLLFGYVNLALTQHSCGGVHGVPGIPGSHGRNGRDGPKGETGDPGESGQLFRGPKGFLGVPGIAGRPGLKGDAGLPGPVGQPGRPGEKGRSSSTVAQARSYFSYKRQLTNLPDLDTTIDFNKKILPDLAPKFQGGDLTNGTFTCVVKGIYFFSYHMSAKSRVCLALMKGSDQQLMMCDLAEGFLVTSGSAILALEAGDTVSLQATKYNAVTSQSSTSHTFTGFLIFPTS